MKNTTLVTTAAAALAVAAISLTASVPSQASAARTTHHLSFVSHTLADRQIGHAGLIEADKVVRNGAVIGYTANSCTFDFASGTARCLVTLARPDGQLRTRVTVDSDSGAVTGKVVGGSGAYAGALGSVSGHATSSSTVAISLRWTD
ncbi:MAG TPA: hypothetical protein VJ872_17530 [Nocardioides sp.]|nr:hypothetical protein [Nocardioides sp.]